MKNKKYSVEIAIPTYNRTQMLLKLINTIPDKYKINVSDNGGYTDLDYFKDKNNVTIKKSSEVLPVFTNWNRALAGVDSDYIVIPSDDDMFLDNAFDVIENEIENNPEIEMFIFGYNNIDENNKILSTWTPFKYEKYDAPFGFNVFKFGVEARMPSVVFSGKLLKRIGCFDEQFLLTAGDSELIQRSLLFGKSLFVPKIIACYRVWSKGATAQTIASKKWMDEIEMWTDKIASIAGTELQKANAEFNKMQFIDEIYARNLMSGVANKLKAEGGGNARRYLFGHRYPGRATLATQLNLVKLVIKSFLRR